MSYKKVIVSGHIIEIYEMEQEPFNPHLIDKEKTDSYNALDISFDLVETMDKNFMHHQEKDKACRRDERRAQTTRDARNRIRRLALSNFDNNSKFITLTFKENITDIDRANRCFMSFIRKLRERLKLKERLKYIAVIEFQDRGAVHYHMLCNIPFTPHETLYDWWRDSIKGQGTVNIKNITSVDNVGAYIVKYMMKNAGDERLRGRKMYLSSRGLDRPKEYKGFEAELVIQQYINEKKKEVFTNSYISEYLGKIVYKEYNLQRNGY